MIFENPENTGGNGNCQSKREIPNTAVRGIYVMKERPRNAGIKNIFAVLASALEAMPGRVSVFALPLSSRIVGINDTNGKQKMVYP